MMGGSFPRSFLIPGTDTSIRVGGEARMNVLYWLNGAPALGNSHQTNPGNTGTVNTAALSQSGAARTRTDNVLHMSPAQSKINVETRTPTAWGEARTFIEFDFSNTTNVGARAFAISDNLGLRLRFAYGTLGGLLAGQANSNFADPDAGVETISFGGLVGGPGHARVPQVRYTMPLAGWGLLGAFSIAAEAPETAAWSPTIGLCGAYGDGATTCPGGAANILKSASPDITAAWYVPQPWGHVDFSAVVRPTLRIEDGTGAVDKSYVGWGIAGGGDVKPRWFGWNRDFFTWQMLYGQALGGYARRRIRQQQCHPGQQFRRTRRGARLCHLQTDDHLRRQYRVSPLLAAEPAHQHRCGHPPRGYQHDARRGLLRRADRGSGAAGRHRRMRSQ